MDIYRHSSLHVSNDDISTHSIYVQKETYLGREDLFSQTETFAVPSSSKWTNKDT